MIWRSLEITSLSLSLSSSATAYRRRRKKVTSQLKVDLAFDCSAANAAHLEERRSLSPFYKKQSCFQIACVPFQVLSLSER